MNLRKISSSYDLNLQILERNRRLALTLAEVDATEALLWRHIKVNNEIGLLPARMGPCDEKARFDSMR